MRPRLRYVGWICLLFVALTFTAFFPLPTQAAQEPLIQYGLTTDVVNARRVPWAENNQPIGQYAAGVMVRYIDEGTGWLRIVHDSYRTHPERALAHGTIYVSAQFVQPITEESVAPVPRIGEHHREIIVDRTQQHLWAYFVWENADRALFLESPVSTGRPGYTTPAGEFRILSKRWSRHMQGVEPSGKRWDLPGIPFVQYITRSGVAFHGTYWHDNFGHPMSHGCINLPLDVAWKLYQFTAPEHMWFLEETKVAIDNTTVVIIK